MKTAEELRKHFEGTTNQASWINSDIYPDGKIYTKSYTEWLEQQTAKLRKEIEELKHHIESNQTQINEAVQVNYKQGQRILDLKMAGTILYNAVCQNKNAAGEAGTLSYPPKAMQWFDEVLKPWEQTKSEEVGFAEKERENEITRLRGLLERVEPTFTEYLDLLNKSNEAPITIAATHGWKCPESEVKQGMIHRIKITELLTDIETELSKKQ